MASVSLSLVVSTGGFALGAPSGDVASKLDSAKRDHAAATSVLEQAKARLHVLRTRYERAQAALEAAARDVVELYSAQQELEANLQAARMRFNDRVAAAYEAGPGVTLELVLSMTSMSDFSSIQEYTARTIAVDSADVQELTDGRAQLASVTARLERRQADLFATRDQLDQLAVEMSAQVELARAAAKRSGAKVRRLERQQQELLAAQARTADSLAGLERSGIIGSGCESGPVHDLIVEAFTPMGQDQLDEAFYIANRESRCNPNAWNPTVVPPYGNAAGVFQILYPGIWEAWTERCGHVGESPFNARANVEVTACIVEQQGWGAWAL